VTKVALMLICSMRGKAASILIHVVCYESSYDATAKNSMVTLLACSSLKMAMDVFIHVGAIFCSWARLSRVGALPVSSWVSVCK